MKKYSIVFVLLFISGELFAQSLEGPPALKYQNTTSTLYIELWGNAGLASFNYDLSFESNYGVRIGASPGLFLLDNENNDQGADFNIDLTGLISAFKLFGSGSHKLETGIGALFGEFVTPRNDNYPSVPALNFNIGYRFVTPKEKGLNLRAMFTPSISKNGLQPWFGVSVGISFLNKAK